MIQKVLYLNRLFIAIINVTYFLILYNLQVSLLLVNDHGNRNYMWSQLDERLLL